VDPHNSSSRADRTRQKILAESARVFNRRGYHATTLDEIARAIGMTKPALYYYVKSKEDLLFQCHQRALDIATDAVRLAMVSAEAADERLRIVLTRYIEGMTAELSGFVVLLHEGALSPALHRCILEQRDHYEGMLRTIVEQGIETGVFVPCDPKLVCFAILGALNWIPRWYSPEGPASSREIAAAFAEFFVRGLMRHPPSKTIGSGALLVGSAATDGPLPREERA
jgi:TetR/AcrR family transcriptional regulator